MEILVYLKFSRGEVRYTDESEVLIESPLRLHEIEAVAKIIEIYKESTGRAKKGSSNLLDKAAELMKAENSRKPDNDRDSWNNL